MMRICISGMTASGKTTLGKLIARELNVEHITKEKTKEYAKLMNDLEQRKDAKLALAQTADSRYAKDFDAEIIKAAKGKNCVVSTWLAPWLIKDATLRVWLNASPAERYRRKARDLGVSIRKAEKFVKEKDSLAAKGFKKVYGIDINDHSVFDIEINTEKLDHKKVVAVISMLAMLKEGKIR